MHFRNHSEQEKFDNVKIITSCCIGEIIPLERLSNDVFSSLILGDGFGAIPCEDQFFSPVDGVIKDVSANNHEITIKTDDNMIVMVSIALDPSADPVEIVSIVKPGDRISQGESIWNVSSERCNSMLNGLTAAVIVTNSDLLTSFNIRYGKVKTINQPVMTITV